MYWDKYMFLHRQEKQKFTQHRVVMICMLYRNQQNVIYEKRRVKLENSRRTMCVRSHIN